MSSQVIAHKDDYDFVGKTTMFFGISILTFVLALAELFGHGLNYGIDFAGGTEVQVKFAGTVTSEDLRAFLETQGLKDAHLQNFGGANEYLIRYEMPDGTSEKEINAKNAQLTRALTDGIVAKFKDQTPDVRRVDSVGPTVGGQLKQNATLALFYALLSILIYVAIRFDYNYAPGAVICLFHDAIITTALMNFLGYEMNIHMLAAVLTLIGYSINDTIIVYDRIRENEDVYKGQKMRDIINRSVNDTMARTILTSTTVMIVCVCLFFLAGGAVAEFGLFFGLGVLFGTYSSVYVAAPMIIIFERFRHFGNVRAVANKA